MARYMVIVEFESEGFDGPHYKTRTYHVDSLPEDMEILYCDELISEEPEDCWSVTDVTVEDNHERYKVTVTCESHDNQSLTLSFYTSELLDDDGVSELRDHFMTERLLCLEEDDHWTIKDISVEDTHEPTYVPAVAGGYMHDSSKHWPKEGK